MYMLLLVSEITCNTSSSKGPPKSSAHNELPFLSSLIRNTSLPPAERNILVDVPNEKSTESLNIPATIMFPALSVVIECPTQFADVLPVRFAQIKFPEESYLLTYKERYKPTELSENTPGPGS